VDTDDRTQHDALTAAASATEPALAPFFAAQVGQYADDVQWSAPRRNLVLQGRESVARHLAAEYSAMSDVRITSLRESNGGAQGFHEFSVRFRLVEPGIVGVSIPPGAEVELERLRVLTRDPDGRVVSEMSVETWTWLPAMPASET
jgi:hypothetical protein